MKIPNQCWPSNMEENTPSQGLNGQLGPSNSVNSAPNKQQDDSKDVPQYSIPGILHFIQHEWARFEMERSQWEVDRAELQARIAFLQGERKGQENLKHDLIRRIKMLEFALKQERAKLHKLKFGTELQQGDMKPPAGLYEEPPDAVVALDSETPYNPVSNVTWRQGRQLLRQYLQEIGYTDTIIDVRSNRVRSLLCLNNNAEAEENLNNAGTSVNGNEASNKRASETQGRQPGASAKKPVPSTLTEAMIMETEAAIMANFDYLGNADVEMDEEDLADDLDDTQDEEQVDVTVKLKRKKGKGLSDSLANDVDAEAEEVLNELNMLSEGGGEDEPEWGRRIEFSGGVSTHRTIPDDNIDCTLLGELAQLTVNNESESSYDVSNTPESFRKTWNAKYTLRSHFDCVRALAFHPTEPVLITASEDNTLKLWNLQKTVPAKKSTSLDVEPLYTFRCHTGPVLAVTMGKSGEHCYSGGLDGAINCWTLPSPNVDPYDTFDPRVLTQRLSGHTNAVCGLSVASNKQHLLSCSADGTVKLWSPHTKDTLLNTFKSEQDGIPTSVDFVRNEVNQIVAAYNSSHCVIYDSETGKPVVRLESGQETGSSPAEKLIYRAVSHPMLPVTMTAHEDRNIRFFDNNSGKLVHSMVAHLDAVTSLAVDPNGLFLLSGSHDCSIRLWNLDTKTCVQEITAHRKKFDESILDVAFHPARPYIASAGADGLAKVFV